MLISMAYADRTAPAPGTGTTGSRVGAVLSAVPGGRAAAAPTRPDAAGRPEIWRDGDPVADRSFADIGDVVLENGAVLPDVRMAYESWGTLNAARDNAVLVLHALTGDAHVVGPAGPGQPTPGWWDGLIGPGAVLDTDALYVIAPNVRAFTTDRHRTVDDGVRRPSVRVALPDADHP